MYTEEKRKSRKKKNPDIFRRDKEEELRDEETILPQFSEEHFVESRL